MATATQPAPADMKPADAAALLDRVIDGQGGKARELIETALKARIGSIEEILPAFMKGQGDRLIKRALLTFSMKKELHGCTPSSFVLTVLQGAECGVAIDGKLGHAVPRNVKISKKGEPDKWEKQACFQPDYKALVAQAKRSGQIRDCIADVVCENDIFSHGKFNGKLTLEHTYDIKADRGKVVGAYAMFILDDGAFHYDLMSEAELEAVRVKARETANSPAQRDHRDEMRKKTVVRRGLKYFAEDPGINRMLELDDEAFVLDAEAANTQSEPVERSKSLSDLTRRLEHDKSPAFTPPRTTTRRETVPSSKPVGTQSHTGREVEIEADDLPEEATEEADLPESDESEVDDGPELVEEESQEEQPEKPAPKGLPADAWQRFETCSSKTNVEQMLALLLDDCRTDEERLIAEDYATRRKQEIHETRGERSNTKGKSKPPKGEMFDKGNPIPE